MSGELFICCFCLFCASPEACKQISFTNMALSALTDNTMSVGTVRTKNRWPSTLDWIAVALLAGLALWLFRGHVFGDTLWIGNPDRLNGDLKYLGHYLSGLEGGKIAAWNEHEMMGYDSLAMAGTSPNPLVYLVSFFGSENLYVSMGYLFVGLMMAAGMATYIFLRTFLHAGVPVLVGAICYEFSTLAVLKNSQNSMTFAVFILIPLFMLVIRKIRGETAAWCFVALTVLLICMLNYMFLQKAAYALMLIGAYAAWRSYNEKSWRPALVFGLAFLVALGFSFPRILNIGLALGEYKRAIDGLNLKDFDALYSFQNIHPYEILRWFDNSIFGLTPSDSHEIKNNINLTEGFLLYTSSIVPLVLLTGLVRGRLSWLNPLRSTNGEAGFFFWILVICIAVIVVKPVAHIMFLLFMRLDFTHARIQISALLPLCLLIALTLSSLAPPKVEKHRPFRQNLAGLALGVSAALLIEYIAQQYLGTITRQPSTPVQAPHLRVEALVRILLSAIFFVLLLRVALAGNERWRHGAHIALCALLASQCLLAADRQVNGTLALNFASPFHWGDYYQARRDEFAPPSSAQLQALHERIQPQQYRVALVCDPHIADGFCAGHVPEFWQLRAIDGYYGPGVPRRLRALPWPAGVSLRTISFTSVDTVPWELLGVLNVRSVLVAGDGVFRNIVHDNGRITGRPDPGTFEIITSPTRVTPRAFFVAAIEPAISPEDAAKKIFRPEGIIDPILTSYVEGLKQARIFGTVSSGAIEIRGRGDTLELRFTASPSERFLVLNDLYYPGWQAMFDGQDLPILPVNAVMRGVVVPAGATYVTFQYASYLDSTPAWAFRLGALILVLGIFLIFYRMSKQ